MSPAPGCSVISQRGTSAISPTSLDVDHSSVFLTEAASTETGQRLDCSTSTHWIQTICALLSYQSQNRYYQQICYQYQPISKNVRTQFRKRCFGWFRIIKLSVKFQFTGVIRDSKSLLLICNIFFPLLHFFSQMFDSLIWEIIAKQNKQKKFHILPSILSSELFYSPISASVSRPNIPYQVTISTFYV